MARFSPTNAYSSIIDPYLQGLLSRKSYAPSRPAKRSSQYKNKEIPSTIYKFSCFVSIALTFESQTSDLRTATDFARPDGDGLCFMIRAKPQTGL